MSETTIMDPDGAISGLLTTLLPGGAGFPPAQDTGMATLLADRLRRANPAYPEQILTVLTCGGAAPTSLEQWNLAAARIEAIEPKLFAEFRKYSYLTYYEQPGVIAAIRAMGYRYNTSPLPEGYPDELFDPARDGPRHTSGRWLRTDEIQRVDLSGLDLENLR